MSRMLYELLARKANKKSYILNECSGKEIFKDLIHSNIIKDLRVEIPDLTLEDFNVPSHPTSSQPVRLLAMAPDYGFAFNIRTLLQVWTEPNLEQNCFTQAQVVKYIETSKPKMRESAAQQIFFIFENGNEKRYVLYFSPDRETGVISDLEDKREWTNKMRKSVLIKQI